ncbi:serine protease [Vibrio sp. S9_S30]|uniref:S1 family peptidase n=1 Tax=Vibrio sp. S9_S30 TaxID=2720226 RepID=UPI001680FA82|nr:serine protease [Vibrio sp. S9_S30]MBD1557842.1 serine protease [Vibrio sp. S9_S30]
MKCLSTSVFVLVTSLVSGAVEAKNLRVVGGTDADYNNWRFFGQIIGENTDQSSCGASYIGNNYMLTAAHCVSRYQTPDAIRVKFSPNNYSSEPEKTVLVTQIILHPSYNKQGDQSYDVAVLKIDNVLQGVETVTLPTLPLNQYVVPGVSLEAVGLGTKVIGNIKPSKLQHVSIEYVSNETCINSQEFLNETNIGVTNFCAGDATGAGLKDTCTGDSGGPLILRSGTQSMQLGIVSFGIGCAKPNTYGVYTDVPKMVSWINSVTATTR